MLLCGLSDIINGKTSINDQIPYACEGFLITPTSTMGLAWGRAHPSLQISEILIILTKDHE